MWTDYFFVLAVAIMLRASWELEKSPQTRSPFLPQIEEEWKGQRNEWSRKAVEGYARAQEKKWRNWDESMFQAKLI